MKKYFDSIANRVFVILLIGMLFAAGITSWLADKEHRKNLREFYNLRMAERIEQIVLSLDVSTPEMREVLLQVNKNFGLQASLVSNMAQAQTQTQNSELAALLASRLGDNHNILITSQHDCVLPAIPLAPAKELIWQPRSSDCNIVYISLRDGVLLRLQLHLPPEFGGIHQHPPGSPFLPPYFALFLILIATLAYVVAQMSTRPIKHLAAAASDLGGNIDQPPLPETGPIEIRQAARAFNAMQSRIKRQIQHRTHMLAAITHDLQTPLTRLRLRMEKVDEADLRQKLINDLAGMQDMVREGLDLARSMDSAEKMQLLDIDSLLDSICADAIEAGQDVTLQGHAYTSVMAQPHALRRCLTNLIDNAVKYGQHARLQIVAENNGIQSHVVITIRDAGKGIPEDQLAMVFEPFVRLETSRSRETGGTGLGLTIARNIAENHNATLTLANHPEGGLVVTLRFPAPHNVKQNVHAGT
ncbi:ATP-binding protein [Sulfuriferula nivalis]|uniref:histidine kinase n=1 Tax=Sulfuriferula nivalis TaxID=2675298 RepID=A0A809SHA7_9PROT|nr:ATP-binding protein [Sulfuriferula nivalis]BBP00640.1 hypothetical protein SFSGTM_13480 [Sulfuriferula nivalis]